MWDDICHLVIIVTAGVRTFSDGISRWVPDKNCTRYNDMLCSEIGRETDTDFGRACC